MNYQANKMRTCVKSTLSFGSIFYKRYLLNRNYVASLKNENLLRSYYSEAGIENRNSMSNDIHKGWESPICQLRGHFTGHWLSACARIYAQSNDHEILGKALNFVDELEKCQEINGGSWIGSIPEKYFWKMKQKQDVWAPHYTVHKLFMGLIDMKKFAGCDKALKIADKWADWFVRYTDDLSKEELNSILNYETGGMLEAWADMLELTGDEKYRTLFSRYYREEFFESLLECKDLLTNRHANTTIPEIHGCARMYEVTGEEKYRKIVEAYWNQAVIERGYFATGGQTSGEIWTPKKMLKDRLSPTNQEHCTVYNMIRLADYLYRWTGDCNYLQYIERNIYGGILAQQNPVTGMVIYYLPLHAGSKKRWGTPTESFWCCHGTLVQAHTLYSDISFYSDGDILTVAQYIDGKCSMPLGKENLEISLATEFAQQDKNSITVDLSTKSSDEYTVQFRIPWWATYTEILDTQNEKVPFQSENGFAVVKLNGNNRITLNFGKTITAVELPGEKSTCAFMCGPEVLVGLCDTEHVITVPKGKEISSIFRMFDELGDCNVAFSLIAQPAGIKFVPIYTVTDELYTVYFPIKTE